MKFKLTKAEFDALSDAEKAQYTAKGDSYQLSIEGLPDFDGMQSKLDKLLDEAKTAKTAKTDADKKAQEEADKAARLSGDIAALEASWGKKLQDEVDAHAATKTRYSGQVSKLMVGDVSKSLAAELFGSNAAVFEHHISSRLQLEEAEGGEFKTRILGIDGKISASTIDDLKKEFAANKQFAPFLVTTKAQGASGATGSDKATTIEQPKMGSFADSQNAIKSRALEIAQSVDVSGL